MLRGITLPASDRCASERPLGTQTSRGPHPSRCGPPLVTDQSLGGNDVLGLGALLTSGDVEGDLLALEQLAVATLRDDVGVVGEDVSVATILLDEAKTLFGVEPLNGASSHVRLLLIGQKTKTALYGFRVTMSPSGETGKQKMHLKVTIPSGARKSLWVTRLQLP